MTERAAYRVKEFAEAIGVDRVTVWRWIKAGKLETIHVAGMTLIPAHILAHIPSGHSMQPSVTEVNSGGRTRRWEVKWNDTR